MLPDLLQSETACPQCGEATAYDALRRCAGCDRPCCPGCLGHGAEPRCPDCRSQAMPQHLRPMLAVLDDALPDDPQAWGFEFKWDGIRILSYWDTTHLRLETRSLQDTTVRYPELHDLGRVLGSCPVILDGEIVALDANGHPHFGLLERRMHVSPTRVAEVAARVPIWYFIFDILYLGTRSTLTTSYRDRRQMLDALPLAHPRCRISPCYPGEGQAVLAVARERGLEGVMAKRLTSPYAPGQRSPDWRKVKLVTEQEFVIGGWTEERHGPARIGALLLGYFDRQGYLRYAGRVGSGFSAETHALLLAQLRPLKRPHSPFVDAVPRAHFVAPCLVAEVAYRRWFPGGLLQQTAFKGLRPDKPATDVIREEKE